MYFIFYLFFNFFNYNKNKVYFYYDKKLFKKEKTINKKDKSVIFRTNVLKLVNFKFKEILESLNDQPAIIFIYDELYKDNLFNDFNEDNISLFNCEVLSLWFKNDKMHRDNDRPASIHYINNHIVYKWLKNGQLHRDTDKPALIDGLNCSYYKNGQLHRENNYAVKESNKLQFIYKWYINGKLHRLNKPAVISFGSNTSNLFFIDGVQKNTEDFIKDSIKFKLKSF